MRNMRNDESGSGVLIVMAIVVFLLVIFVAIPFILGWAVTFLMTIFTGDPEITSFWTRWFIGVALMIVSIFLIPSFSPARTVNNYYRSDGKDFRMVWKEG